MKILKNKICYEFKPYIKVFKQDIEIKNLKIKDFHRVEFPDSVMVIVKKEKKYLLLKEYRVGLKKKALSFPGGHIDKNETPIKAAKRELLEETGIVAKNWKKLSDFTRSGTYYCGKETIYLTEFKKKIKNSIIDKEIISSHWYSANQLLKMFKNSKFQTPGMAVSIMWLFYHLGMLSFY